ncbi:hypothetical protein VNO78_06077 [Psophocarpus tetragonolobus]|uniref:AB hydrolase-1 domain-containing protein n=1 Tax=Psophocarpus tetragonolobus TaxID=3891 RepID=A0AAN9XQV7_PSOTE
MLNSINFLFMKEVYVVMKSGTLWRKSSTVVKGLKLHVAEIGSGSKAVVFLHGFPEISYTWRHQMIAVASAGCRGIALDFRGYGLSEYPAEPEKETMLDLIDEISGYLTAVVHPERVAAVINLGVPFMLPGPSAEPGRAEADFGRFPVESVIQNIYTLFSRSEIPIAADDQETMDLFDPSTPLPPWFSEEDLATYASLYENSGFRYALQVPYRALNVETGLSDVKVNKATLLIMGEKDYIFKFPGMEDYIRSGAVKSFVPDLEISYIPEGSHFVHEQIPEKVNQLIIEFLDKQKYPAEACGSEGTEAARGRDWKWPFPECSKAVGYIAFDFRGYGLSEQPAELEKETVYGLVDEIVGLLHSSNISKTKCLLQTVEKAFLVGMEFGATAGYLTAAVHPERVAAVINFGVPFSPPGPAVVLNGLPNGFRNNRWQEPGRADADFGRFPVKSVIRNLYTLFSRSEIPIAAADQEIMDLVDPSTPLPPWFSEEDLQTYASLYEKSGFRYALQFSGTDFNNIAFELLMQKPQCGNWLK